MTVQEARKARVQLEINIEDLIKDFQEETGVAVNCVSVVTEAVRDELGNVAYRESTGVDVGVRL